MPDMLSLIGAAQSSLKTAQSSFSTADSTYQQAQAAYDKIANTPNANPTQVAAAKATLDNAWVQQTIALGTVRKYQDQLGGLQQSYNTALTQASNPTQQQAIASKLYTQNADVARNTAITNVQTAIADGEHPEVISFLKNEATSAEDYYQSMLTGSNDDFDSFTADIAGSVGLADLGDITGSDLLDFDDGSGGDSAGGGASGSDIVVTGRREDKRLRIKPFSGSIDTFLSGGSANSGEQTTDQAGGGSGGSILDPLKPTNGVVFPYTPTISFNSKVNYNPVQPTHANTDYWIYQNTPAVQFTIQGQFTAQTEEEAKYMLAAMHFFRAATKMRFGEQDDDRGFGPPLLKLYGYGSMMMRNLAVVLINFNMELPNTVNYVSVDTDIGEQWVPALTTFNLECVVQHTPAQERQEFNWQQFASGELLNGGTGWF